MTNINQPLVTLHRAAVWSVLLCVLTACNPPSKTQTPGKPHRPKPAANASAPSIDQVIGYYKAGRFQAAYDGAVRLVRIEKGQPKQEALLMAGLSAFRLNRLDEAVRFLEPTTANANSRVSGPANSALGQIYDQRKQYPQAKARYLKAVRQLKGQDLAEANYRLGVVCDKLGQGQTARLYYNQAVLVSSDPSFRKKVRSKLSFVGYAVQFGAYSSQKNAAARMNAVSAKATQAGLGPVRVVQKASASGRTLYVVQAGRFETFEKAAAGRSRFGATGTTIVPYAGP